MLSRFRPLVALAVLSFGMSSAIAQQSGKPTLPSLGMVTSVNGSALASPVLCIINAGACAANIGSYSGSVFTFQGDGSALAFANATAARVALGLGTAATLNVGTTSNPPTVASGGDSRILGAVQAVGGDASGTKGIDAGATTSRFMSDWLASVPIPATSVAKCDGITDDGPALSALSASLPKGSVIQTPRGRQCYVGTNLTIASGVQIRGPGGTDNPGGTNQAVSLASIGGLLLENSAKVVLNGGSGLVNMIVLRADNGVQMTLPAADASAYAGTCIQPPATASDGYVVDNVLCVGQAKALVSTGSSRAHVRLAADVNPGTGNAAVTFGGSNDTSTLDVRLWPYGTSDKTGAPLNRIGTGILIQGQNDDTFCPNLFAISYDINVDFESTQSVHCNHVWTDTSYVKSGTIGLKFGASTSNVTVADLQAWGDDYGLVEAGGSGNRNVVTSAHFDTQSVSPVLVSGGNIHIGDGTVRNAPLANPIVTITNTASYVSGLINDEVAGTVSPVTVPAAYTSDHIADLKVVSPYRSTGIATYSGSDMTCPFITVGDPVLLPPSGDCFSMSSMSSSRFSGGWQGRKVTIRFVNGGIIYYPGNIYTKTGANRYMPSNTVARYEYDEPSQRWHEIYNSADEFSASPAPAVVAAGSSGSGCTQIVSNDNDITTAPSGSCVFLPTGVGRYNIWNDGANSILVYPSKAGSQTINAAASLSLAAGAHALIACLSGTVCRSGP